MSLFWDCLSFCYPPGRSEGKNSHWPFLAGTVLAPGIHWASTVCQAQHALTSMGVLSPTLCMAVSNTVVPFFLKFQVRAARWTLYGMYFTEYRLYLYTKTIAYCLSRTQIQLGILLPVQCPLYFPDKSKGIFLPCWFMLSLRVYHPFIYSCVDMFAHVCMLKEERNRA